MNFVREGGAGYGKKCYFCFMDSRFSLSQELKQLQRLTPMQVQFVRMLEMPAAEAEEEVQRMLDEMPALEAVPADGDLLPGETADSFNETAGDLQRADYWSPDDMPDYLDSRAEQGQYTEPVWMGMSARRNVYDDFRPVQEASAETLAEHLTAQLPGLDLDDKGKAIAEYIIGSLDDNGYMTRSVQSLADDLAINEGVDATPQEVAKVLEGIRSLDPAGVAAEGLRDCLLLQLNREPDDERYRRAAKIISDYFDPFSKRHFDRVARSMGLSSRQMDEAVEVISRLNPKPGAQFVGAELPDRAQYITPDFFVDADRYGRLTLTQLSHIPELRVAASFEESTPVKGKEPAAVGLPSDAERFIRSKRDDARNFIKVVEMRRQTLFNVMSAILQLQRPFFLTGDEEQIRPMVLRDVADLTGYDLSVISRATQGKYVATRQGIYPLKKFFNEKVSADNDDVTVNRINAALRRAVQGEDPAHPLSDRLLADILMKEGLPVARRTIAKYRENLGIPVARLRKNRPPGKI